MNRKKCLALFLCVLFLQNAVFGGLLAEDTLTPADAVQALRSAEEPRSPSADPQADPTEALLPEVTPEPEADPTEEPLLEVTPEPEADPTLGPLPEVTPEPEADPTAEPFSEVTPEPEADPTQEPLPEVTPEPETTQEARPTPSSAPELKRSASKTLPALAPVMGEKSLARSFSLSFSVTPDLDYINLNDVGGSADITWTIETSGGTGTILYAFDVYKDDAMYAYMGSYGSSHTHSIRTSDPGRYSVRAFVYEVDTGIELIDWSWETGVSALAITGVRVTPSSPVVGNNMTWTVETTGGTGRLNYTFYLFKIVGAEYEYLKGEFESTSNSISYQVTVPADYELTGTVNEPDLTWFRMEVPDNRVTVSGTPTLTVSGVTPDKITTMIGEPITFTVDAVCDNPIQCEFYVYADDYRLESSGWINSDSYEFTPQRSGNYRVEVFVRDSGNPDIQYRADSDTVGVSNLQVRSITANSITASPGDTISWTVDVSGWSGSLSIEATIWLDGRFECYASAGEDGVLSCVAQSPGDYRALIEIGDQYKYFEEYSEFITVNLAAPDLLSAEAVSDSSIQVTWSAVDGATGYMLSRATDPAGTYTFIRLEPSQTYTDAGRTAGTAYYYKVRAIFQSDDAFHISEFSQPIVGIILGTPANLKTASVNGESISITWNAVPGATGYELSRRTGTAGDFSVVYNGTAAAYTDADAQAGIDYYYRVRAYFEGLSTYVYGGSSESVSGNILAAPPRPATESRSGSSIRITWKEVSGAHGYELSRRIGTTGAFVVVYSGTAAAFTDTGRVAGTIYYYRVRAYQMEGSEQLFGDYSLTKAGAAVARPKTPAATPIGRRTVRVTWTPVRGTSGYELWRSTSPSGTYTRVYRGASSAFRNTSLTSGRTYYYKVRAYKRVGTVSLYGPFSAIRAVKPR